MNKKIITLLTLTAFILILIFKAFYDNNKAWEAYSPLDTYVKTINQRYQDSVRENYQNKTWIKNH